LTPNQLQTSNLKPQTALSDLQQKPFLITNIRFLITIQVELLVNFSAEKSYWRRMLRTICFVIAPAGALEGIGRGREREYISKRYAEIQAIFLAANNYIASTGHP
jgi:hypothetical protein